MSRLVYVSVRTATSNTNAKNESKNDLKGDRPPSNSKPNGAGKSGRHARNVAFRITSERTVAGKAPAIIVAKILTRRRYVPRKRLEDQEL